MDENTYEEMSSFVLSRLNIYVLLSTIVVLIIILVSSIIIFTPLREYIPGYADVNLRRDVVSLKLKSDSLAHIVYTRDSYIQNIRNILSGNIDTTDPEIKAEERIPNNQNFQKISYEDSLLRVEMEQQEGFQLLQVNKSQATTRSDISDLYFFTPIKGFITSGFNADGGHYGIDIVGPENEPIKSTLGGYVFFSSWTSETGYVLCIQHDHNLISTYKHNSVLLKKAGDYVNAGDVIAIIGSSGEYSTGPHLHFELWHNGLAVNPENFVVF